MNNPADSLNLTNYIFPASQQVKDTAMWSVAGSKPDSVSLEMSPIPTSATLTEKAASIVGDAGEPIPYRLAEDNVNVGLWMFGFVVLTATFLRLRSLIRAGWWQALKISDAEIPSLTLHWWDYLLAFLSCSLMLTFAVYSVSGIGADILDGEIYRWLMVIVVTVFLFVFFVVRLAVQSWINAVFWESKVVNRWRASFLLATAVAAFLLFLVGLTTTYTPKIDPFIPFMLLFIYVLFKFFLLFSEITIFSSAKTAFSHIILYICTLEILPLFFLWKFVEFLSTNTTITDII